MDDKTLELGQVQENDFYSHILHDDLDSIVRDIREAHLKDKTTADPQPTLDEVKENFEQAIQMGTDTEAILVWIFQISYGFFNGCEVPAAGRVGNGGRRGLRWCFRLRWFQGYRWRLVLVYGANIARY